MDTINQKDTFFSYKVDALAKLSKWDELDKNLSNLHQLNSFEVFSSKTLLFIKKGEFQKIEELSKMYSNSLITNISVSLSDKIKGLFEYHIIGDIKIVVDEVTKCQKIISIHSLQKRWSRRLEHIPKTSETYGNILSFQACVLSALKAYNKSEKELSIEISKQISQIYLNKSKIARKEKLFQLSFDSLLKATDLDSTIFNIELSKLYWDQDDKIKAITTLRNIQKCAQLSPIDLEDDEITDHSQTIKFLLTKWNEITSSESPENILSSYKNITNSCNYEKPFFYMGKYYFELYKKFFKIDKLETRDKFLMAKYSYECCISYLNGLSLGKKYCYQMFPRLITLWLDFENIYKDIKHITSKKHSDSRFQLLDTTIKKGFSKLENGQFSIILTQIISRLCHKNENIISILVDTIFKIFMEYPQQVLWYLAPSIKSHVKLRNERTKKIIDKMMSNDKNNSEILKSFNHLISNLIKLCDASTSRLKNGSLILSKVIPSLTSTDYTKIIIPTQNALTITFLSSIENKYQNSPFVSSLPSIKGFADKIKIMPSVVKPKKICINGTDNNEYYFLCKPKDDLRKDNRVMEFNSLVNQFLNKDSKSRERSLYIRTYGVIPLNEESGLIEWVNNTEIYKNIIMDLYSEKQDGLEFSVLEKLYKSKNKDPKEFENRILIHYPSIFHKWFYLNFSQPSQWFNSRLKYTRTMAVMSMVGYILGLGDRHGENILMDKVTGDLVHVDFNCLFDKGLEFNYPEKVPFRLTHNMVDALGIEQAIEGNFKTSCEITLQILRSNFESLETVLESFIYDPLWEYDETPKKTRSTIDENVSKIDENFKNNKAAIALSTIQSKLDGSHFSGMNLSVEGLVRELVAQATDLSNLFQMYIGWASYI